MNQLARSESDRMIAGVCGGLAHYLGLDPLIIRIVFVVLALTNGVGIAIYALLWIFVPGENAVWSDRETTVRENVDEIRDTAVGFTQDAREGLEKRWDWSTPGNLTMTGGAVLIGVGLLLLMQNLGLLRWVGRLWPLALVAVGVVILLNNLKEKV